MSEKTDTEIFSLQRTTRQNENDMIREMHSFVEYWTALNSGNSKVPVKTKDYKNWNGRRFSYDTISRFYGSWENACEKPIKPKPPTVEQLLTEIRDEIRK